MRGAAGPYTLNRTQHDGNNVAHCISCSCNGETSVRKLMLSMHDEEDEDADGGGTATQYNKYSHYNITTWQTTPYHRWQGGDKSWICFLYCWATWLPCRDR